MVDRHSAKSTRRLTLGADKGYDAGGFPMLRNVFADGGHAGPELREALKAFGRWTAQIVERSDTA